MIALLGCEDRDQRAEGQCRRARDGGNGSMLSSSGYASPYGSASSSFSGSSDQPTGWWALGLTRILVGILWYTQLLWKSPPDWGSATNACTTNMKATGLTGLCNWLHLEATHPISADL